MCVCSDLYTPVIGQSAAVDDLLMRLRNRIRSEIEFQKDLYSLMGQLELLMSAAGAAEAVIADESAGAPVLSAV